MALIAITHCDYRAAGRHDRAVHGKVSDFVRRAVGDALLFCRARQQILGPPRLRANCVRAGGLCGNGVSELVGAVAGAIASGFRRILGHIARSARSVGPETGVTVVRSGTRHRELDRAKGGQRHWISILIVNGECHNRRLPAPHLFIISNSFRLPLSIRPILIPPVSIPPS